VIGITAAALLTTMLEILDFGGDIPLESVSIDRIYQAWVWMAFALNSCMTASILWRIRYADSSLNISVIEPLLTRPDLGVLGIFADKDLAATQPC
jgi:ABC-type transport system involved in cytochrome c biogenesis permease component